MLVVAPTAFNFWTVFLSPGLASQGHSFAVLDTTASFPSLVTCSTIDKSPYNSAGLTNASMQAALCHIRTSEHFSKGLILMICCLGDCSCARTTVEGSTIASNTEPIYVTCCTRAIRPPSTVSASGTSPPPMCI